MYTRVRARPHCILIYGFSWVFITWPPQGDKWVAVKWIRANAIRHTASKTNLKFKTQKSKGGGANGGER